MVDEEKKLNEDAASADAEDASAGEVFLSPELIELVKELKRFSVRRKVFRILAIAVPVISVAFTIGGFILDNTYKFKLNSLYSEYRSSHQYLMGQLRDKDSARYISGALTDVTDVLDRMAAVDVPDTATERRIDELVEQEKQFVTDYCKGMQIVYSGSKRTAEEDAWAEDFFEGMREEDELYRFRKEMGEIVAWW